MLFYFFIFLFFCFTFIQSDNPFLGLGGGLGPFTLIVTTDIFAFISALSLVLSLCPTFSMFHPHFLMKFRTNETHHFLKIYFTEVQLIYNVVLIPAVQQIDSVIHIYTFFFIFFSIMVYHRILNIVRTLLFIHSTYNSLHLLIPNSQSIPPPPLSPLATTSLFSMSVSLFLFHR